VGILRAVGLGSPRRVGFGRGMKLARQQTIFEVVDARGKEREVSVGRARSKREKGGPLRQYFVAVRVFRFFFSIFIRYYLLSISFIRYNSFVSTSDVIG